MNLTSYLMFGLPGGMEWVVVLVIGLLIFGKRLPEIARSLGRGVVEFKRGIKGIEDDIDHADHADYEPPQKIADDRPADRPADRLD